MKKMEYEFYVNLRCYIPTVRRGHYRVNFSKFSTAHKTVNMFAF